MDTNARVPGNLFDPNCPTRQVLDRVGDKWTVMIVEILAASGPVRFTELRGQVVGVTPKVLTQVLRALERDGLVDRQVFAEVPPRVEYSLTPIGASLRAPLASIRAWAESHVGAISGAQQRFDARPPASPRRPRK